MAGGRRRKYPSLEVVGEFETAFKQKQFSKKDLEQLFGFVASWMRDLRAWGEDVRDDIIRVEGAVGLSTGDTGDPPPAPRR
jgi:hypothetical protein